MSEQRTRIALLAVLAGLGAALAGTLARRRQAGGPSGAPAVPAVEPRTSRGEPPAAPGEAAGRPDEPAGSTTREEARRFTCQCGQEYRTTGVGRHRVYWPADASEAGAVLGDACPECGTPLPAEPTGSAT
jgi:hypothetical protein